MGGKEEGLYGEFPGGFAFPRDAETHRCPNMLSEAAVVTRETSRLLKWRLFEYQR